MNRVCIQFSGDRVREVREAMGLSLEQFAAQVGAKRGKPVARQAIHQYENGAQPRPDMFVAIAAVSGMPMEWFFSNPEEQIVEGELPPERFAKDEKDGDADRE